MPAGKTGTATPASRSPTPGPASSGADLDRIFVPFERLTAEQSDVEGTGIGLPLARALAQVMRGSLRAMSTLGQGSTFTVSLQRAQALTDVPSQRGPRRWSRTQTATLRCCRSALTLLYIEDNPANVEVVARYLRGHPHARLVTASSGADGLAAAAEHQPDLVLLDLHLTDMSGEQVLSGLIAEPGTGDIPVAVLSADASPRIIRRLLSSGACAYLTKPVDLARLGELLDTFAAARAQDQQPQPPSPDRAGRSGRCGAFLKACPGACSGARKGGLMNHTLLYIEDDENNISLIQALLKRRPHIELHVAMNGRDGVQAAIDKRPGTHPAGQPAPRRDRRRHPA